MATILEQYYELGKKLQMSIDAKQFNNKDLPLVQELNYRIDVLKVFEIFCKTAPVTTNLAEIAYHYQMVNAHLCGLLTERRFGPKKNEEGQKRQRASYDALESVITEGKKRFSSAKVNTSEQYKQDISQVIRTVLPAWVQYRNSFVEIPLGR